MSRLASCACGSGVSATLLIFRQLHPSCVELLLGPQGRGAECGSLGASQLVTTQQVRDRGERVFARLKIYKFLTVAVRGRRVPHAPPSHRAPARLGHHYQFDPDHTRLRTPGERAFARQKSTARHYPGPRRDFFVKFHARTIPSPACAAVPVHTILKINLSLKGVEHAVPSDMRNRDGLRNIQSRF